MTRALLFALLLSTPALAQPAPHGDPGTGPMGAMDRMDRAMREAPMTGDPDHDFVAMMIPHHQGAVDMAQNELQHGHDPALRRLARDIIRAQQREIAFMQRWLAGHSR